ncbi:MAG TPA: hypothetical protein VL598_07415 [Trinickia sp.]|jgi:hypothetical protein|uniref:hypothetical protein n=1 Tax=Trinickia sp. TaxID=2571163 RepID=UPI002CC3BB41|nr:hypothetical protein [Trinickia sp.]HTI17476.1 hypothetical protein [Trinickia sp.]
MFATTEYVAFSDDDTHWEASSLREVCVLDSAPHVAVLSGKVLVSETSRIDPMCWRMNASPLDREDLPGPALIAYMAGACVFRTSVFRALGG